MSSPQESFRLRQKLTERQSLVCSESRDREKLTALKSNNATRRFVDELNRAEDALQTTRKQIADLEQQKSAALDGLNNLISALSYDWDVAATK